MTSITILISAIVLFFLSKIFIAIWVYRDARSRNLEAVTWTVLILLFSGVLIFLLYMLVVRKGEIVQCQHCKSTQPAELDYCGRCGKKIESYELEYPPTAPSKSLLILGLIIAIIGIALTSIFIINEIQPGPSTGIPISLMQFQSKFGDKWTASFKYRNGSQSHDFKIDSHDALLDFNWNIKEGHIKVTISHKGQTITELTSLDEVTYKGGLGLKEYKGEKIKVTIESVKASGDFAFQIVDESKGK